MNQTNLNGKVAVVNGASRGIGEAIARGLAACGAQVVLTSRRVESAQEVADSMLANWMKSKRFLSLSVKNSAGSIS